MGISFFEGVPKMWQTSFKPFATFLFSNILIYFWFITKDMLNGLMFRTILEQHFKKVITESRAD